MTTWWSGGGKESKAEVKARKEQERRAREEQCVKELRSLLSSDEGRLCGKQLADGGEFGREGRPEELLSNAYLRRWLVARDWQVDVTYRCLIHHGGWRARISPKGYIEEERVRRPIDDQKVFLQGVDFDGRALVVIQVRRHFSKKRDLKEMKLFTCYIMDSMVALCDRERNPTCRIVGMFDMTGASMANMDAACMTNILGMLSVHYVERLSAMYFYNPPSMFWALWNASKHLLPEVTRSKIKVIDPKDLTDLRSCVPPDVLPMDYGGLAELRPVEQACRHFKLPPFDGRETEEAQDWQQQQQQVAGEQQQHQQQAAGKQQCAGPQHAEEGEGEREEGEEEDWYEALEELEEEESEEGQAHAGSVGGSSGSGDGVVDARLVVVDGLEEKEGLELGLAGAGRAAAVRAS